MKLITTHINADFDAFASLIAAKKLYPGAKAVFPGNYEKKVKEFLQLYSEQFKLDRLKDILQEEVDELIIVDTSTAGRIGALAKLLAEPKLKVTVYDHHPAGPENIKGDYKNKNEHVGATISLFIREFKERGFEITTAEATLFALALYEETGSFSYASTTPLELNMMAYLLEKGADLNIVMDFLKEGFSPEQEQLFKRLLATITTYDIMGIPVKIAVAETDQYVKDIALVVHKLRDMGNLDVIIALVKLPESVHMIARSSLKQINAGEIMKEFGGGGHESAASASLNAVSLGELNSRLLEVLREKVKPFLRAKDIMSSPVLSIKPSITCEEARKIMLRFNHNSLPVIENKKLLGIVSITELDKCIQHNFNDKEISGYIRTGIATVSPEISLNEIQNLMVDENVGKLPVLDASGGILGIVTRTDVLKSINKNRLNEKVRQIEKALESAAPETLNVKGLLEQRLPRRILEMFTEIGAIAKAIDVKAFVVGGFVRDLLLGIENYDIDLVVEGDGLKFAGILAKKFKMPLKKHKKFGTAVLVYEGKIKIDVATARVEFYDYPASAPQVEFSHIKYDLYRRDFTINTMAIELDSSAFGTLVDFFGGRRDLKAGLIRVLHNMSFVEDPTRIFRAIRFEQRYGLKIERSTQNYLSNAIELEMFDRLATHKIKDEIVLILNEDYPLKALNRMKQLEVLKYIHPDLKITPKMKELFNGIHDSFAVEALFMDEKVKKWLVNFMVLLDGLKLKDCRKICERFKLDGEAVRKVIEIKEGEEHTLHTLNRARLSNSGIYNELSKVPMEGLLFYLSKTGELRVKQRLHLYISSLSKIKLELTGEDLKALGLKPGPVYKEIFAKLLDAKLNGLVKDREEELKFVSGLKLRP
ncbi:MAG: CBS domain-containing protein [Candidatus Firestonebacteria bacterium]